MMILRHTLFVLSSSFWFAIRTRSFAVFVVLIGGLLVLLATLSVQISAPWVLYPFA